MSFKNNKVRFIIICLALLGCGVVVYYYKTPFNLFNSNKIEYNVNQVLDNNQKSGTLENIIVDSDVSIEVVEEPVVVVTHIATPKPVKALYVTAWTAGSSNFSNYIVKMIEDTELNAIVIDIKDSTGRLGFNIDDPLIKEIGSSQNRIKNIKELTALLHSKDIYIIGRISVFQDPYLTKLKPEWAIKKVSDGGVWKDKKGLSFLDPTNKNVQDYIINIAKNSYAVGFDEINFDYIRYPSDGNIKDIKYNLTDGKTRAGNMEDFFKYLSSELKKDENIPISADVFGLATEVMDDMGIGQVWEKIIPYFDFICPMIYPSHYPSGYLGYKNPSMYPYEVINRALKGAVNKTTKMNEDINKIRPWLQDFDMGATYDKKMIEAQMKGVYDNNLDSWLLWNPSNKYTKEALLPPLVTGN